MKNPSPSRPVLKHGCQATTIGTLLHIDVVQGTTLVFDGNPKIPLWVQLPKRNPYENMMFQFTDGCLYWFMMEKASIF